MPLQFLKELLGHKDIRMTLGYAAITQEALRREYFTAITRIHTRYETASYPLRAPDLRQGVIRSFSDVKLAIKKYTQEHATTDAKSLQRLEYRLNSLRHEFSVLLNISDANEEPAAIITNYI